MSNADVRYRVQPGGTLSGELRVPGDKSISHRSVILGAVAEGSSRVTGILRGTDVLATIAAFRKMGVQITGPDGEQLHIQGVGLHGLSAPRDALDLGNSGTAMRLLAGLLSGQSFTSTLVGDESLSRRPMQRVTGPLAEMGAQVATCGKGTPPLTIRPATGAGLKGIRYRMPMASAQVKSALLLAGLYADGKTCVEESAPTRDHTERMLNGFGYGCEHSGGRACLRGGGRLQGTNIDVPADLSSAAFFIVAATIAAGSRLRLRHVGVNSTRAGVLDILRRMGASIQTENQREICGEPVADIVVQSARLHGITVPTAMVPLAIDEFPILCIAAACAGGNTTFRGAAELRHKESDRISTMVTGLSELGVPVVEYEDGMRISGSDIGGGKVDSAGDHRIAMAFCMAGMIAGSSIEVLRCGNIETSFPGFLKMASASGIRIDDIS